MWLSCFFEVWIVETLYSIKSLSVHRSGIVQEWEDMERSNFLEMFFAARITGDGIFFRSEGPKLK